MKNILTIGLAALVVLLLASCTKSNFALINSKASILGKWDLVSDSKFEGVGSGNHPVNYVGQAGDYFDFRADGNLYTKENTVLDTLPYNFTSANTIVIASFGVILNGTPEVSHITTLTPANATITAPVLDLPAGEFGRTVHLRR